MSTDDKQKTEQMESRLSLRDAEKVIIIAGVIQLVLSLVTIFFSLWGAGVAAFVEGLHLLGGFGLWIVVYLHQRLRRAAREEEQEMAELEQIAERDQRSTLFETEGIDPYSARTKLEKFEKYFLPTLTALGAVVLGVFAYFIFRRVRPSAAALGAGDRYLPTLALMWAQALVCLLFGKYAAGMATQRPWRPLRAGGSYMVSNAVACFLVGAGQGAAYIFKVPVVDRYIGLLIGVGVALLALETILNLLMDFYRPRVSGLEQRPVYDSRLLGLFTQPTGIVKTAAETLDYQFGFKVSETWFYKFMERAIAPLIVFQLLTLYLLTCFVVIASDEQAIVERMGRTITPPLEPGLHLKLPWPFDRVYRYETGRVHSVTITGEAPGEQAAHAHEHEHEHEHEHSATELESHDIIWTQEGHEHVYFIVGSRVGELEGAEAEEAVGVSYLAGTFLLQYRITDVLKCHRHHAEPRETVKMLAQREIIRFMTGIDFFEFFGPGRKRASDAIRRRTQEAADRQNMGIEIIFVGVHDLHPPREVAGSFEDLFAAQIRAQKIIADARAEREILQQKALQRKETMIRSAEVEKFRRVHLAEKEAERFRIQLTAFEKGGEVYLAREFFRALRDSLAHMRKLILPSTKDGRRITILDMEEKSRPAGLDFGVEEGD